MLLAGMLLAAAPDWWLLPGPVAYDQEVINLVDRSSIGAPSPGVAQVTLGVVLRTRRDGTSYLLGRREYRCARYEYRDLWVQPMGADDRPAGGVAKVEPEDWRDAEAGTAAGVIGAMACRAFHDWRAEGFRKVDTLEKARAAIDRATSL